MELPWVLLALAGTGAAADLGDSPGDRAEGERGLEGLRGVCPGTGLWGWAWLGDPHTSTVPLMLAPCDTRLCQHWCGRGLGSGAC